MPLPVKHDRFLKSFGKYLFLHCINTLMFSFLLSFIKRWLGFTPYHAIFFMNFFLSSFFPSLLLEHLSRTKNETVITVTVLM